jgi:tetratricopeptide (TPR) repeat protein
MMNDPAPSACSEEETLFLAPLAHASLALPEALGHETPKLLQRMFRDPRVLEPEERGDLIVRLRQAVELAPHVPEVRVLLGMALCVDLQAQDALEELREAAKQAPDCFIAHLKFGELLMRLRIVGQAAEETQKAAKLAVNAVQSDLARKQAATIRTMTREGIERGGYGGLISHFFHFPRKSRSTAIASAMMGSK